MAMLFSKMYEQSKRCNFKTISSISSSIRVFSASLPAIASGEKPSAKRRFFDMAFFQRNSTGVLSEYHSNKTNGYRKSAQSAINRYRIHRRATRNINQTKPIVSLHVVTLRSDTMVRGDAIFSLLRCYAITVLDKTLLYLLLLCYAIIIFLRSYAITAI